jgi:glyoxylase-like metal-dependent hydrolase (beta-lactamase superfamily II)
MTPAITAVTDRVHFVETDLVNWTMVTDGDGVMLVDAGFPGQRDDVLTALATLGAGPADVRAILLTHAHVDHFGTALWFARRHRTPVYCHPAEVRHARREYLEQASPVAIARQAWQPRWLKWSVQIVRAGALTHDGIPSAAALTDEVAATLPGRPVAVATPGHTGGHASFLVDGVLISGDALVTGHPLLPTAGPQLLPSAFNHDEAQCRRSLLALAAVDAQVILPGHGPLWRGAPADAVRTVP